MDGGRGSSAWPRQLPGTRRGRLMPVKKASEIIVRLGLQRRTTEALEALLDILPALFIQELDSELWRVLRNSLESTKDGSEVAAQVLRLLIEANLRNVDLISKYFVHSVNAGDYENTSREIRNFKIAKNVRKHPTFLHTKALSDYFSTLASFRDELARFRSDSSEDHNEEYLVKQRFAWESRLGQLLDALAKNQDSDLLLLCAVQISELTEEFADIVFDAIEKFIVDNPEHPNGYRIGLHFLKYSYVDAHEQMAELVEKLLGLDPTSEFGLVEMLELYKLNSISFEFTFDHLVSRLEYTLDPESDKRWWQCFLEFCTENYDKIRERSNPLAPWFLNQNFSDIGQAFFFMDWELLEIKAEIACNGLFLTAKQSKQLLECLLQHGRLRQASVSRIENLFPRA